ncbi:TonB-dependent receptor [Caulobacter soli]|uniref:TonB-dependent receptor n=1 Tax=Caulobacter soli TaxID=2708539 RepID=UPI0013EA48B8|nr:TonB-dependent receptor [Caulobacter soli]
MIRINKGALLRRVSALALASLAVSAPALAADLRGRVVDAAGAPLPGAWVEAGGRSTTAGPDGRFVLSNVVPGATDVTVAYVGYSASTLPVTVADAGNEVLLTLKPTDEVSEVVVSSARAAERRSLQVKKVADNFVEALYANDVGKLPDQNVAEAVRRLPGVSVANDQGEGRYVIIRGVDPRYVNVTVNGQTAAAPEPDSRQVKLDDIPSAMIGSVKVIKSLTADLDASAIAGQVDIVTLSAFDRHGIFGSLRGDYGQFDLNDKNPYQVDAQLGGTFGPDGQFGAVVSANYSKRPVESQNVAGASWANGLPTDFDTRDYNLVRERTGFVGNFDWRPTDDVQLYLRSAYSKFTDHETRDRFRLPIAGTIVSSSATTGSFTKATGTRYVRRRDEDDNTKTVSVGGRFNLPVGHLDVDAAYSRAEKTDPLRSEFQFATGKTMAGTYDTSDVLFLVTPTATAYDPAQYTFKSTNYDRREAVEELKQARADYSYPLAMVGEGSELKVGAKLIDRSKTNDRDYTTYDPGATAFTLAALNPPTLDSTYDGRYKFGPMVNYEAAQAYVTAHPATLKLNVAKSLSTALLSDYDVSEKIYAGYAMATLKLGRVTLVPGLRVETTDGDYTAKTFNNVTSKQGPDTTGSNKYTNWFPSLNAKMDVTDRLVLRAAATTAIGRPDYVSLAPAITVDATADTVTQGNPGLKPLLSANLDAGLEYYLPGQGVLSVAAFFKDIQDPIFTQTLLNQSGTYGGVALTGAAVTTPLNASKASIAGIEFNAQSQLTFLPGALDGFGVGANLALIDSTLRGVPGRGVDSLPLAQQSKTVATAQLFYEKYGFSARVAYSYRSKFLYTIGADQGSDVWWDDHGQLDARAAYAFGKTASIFIEGSNLNDEPWRTFVGSDHHLGENERYGRTFRTGVQLSF